MSRTWPSTTIGNLFEVAPGKMLNARARSGEPQYPFLRTANVLWGRVDLATVDRMHFTPEDIASKTLRSGDLLVCEGGDIGRAAIWKGDIPNCGYQNHLHRLRPKRAEVVPAFYMYALQAGFTLHGRYAGAGNRTTIPNLSRSRLEALDVPFPPLEEQQRIVSTLDALQVAAELQVKRAHLLRQLKRSTANQLFGSSSTEEWPLMEPTDIFKLTSGAKRPAHLAAAASEHQPFRVYGGNGVMGYSSEWMVDEPATLVIGRVGEYCGAIHVAQGKVWITDNALYAREWLNPNADVDFVAAFLEHYDLNRFKNRAGQPLVSQSIVNEHPIPIPGRVEQRRVVETLNTIQQAADLADARATVLKSLFMSVLDRVMTGELELPATPEVLSV